MARIVLIERLAPTLKTKETATRALAISRQLRQRGGWFVTSAHVSQCWTLRLDQRRYRIDAGTSLFLEGSRGPGIVFNITIRSVRSKRPMREHVLSSPWLRGLQARLGEHYNRDDDTEVESIGLVRILRGPIEPSITVSELHRIAAAIEGKAIAHRRSRRARKKSSREPRVDDDVCTVLEELRTTGWRVGSLSHGVRRQVQRVGCRWHVWASFNALVTSSEGSPGFAAMIDCWSRRAKGRNLISKATALLRRTGHRRLAAEHYQRWHRGLGRSAVEQEIHLLEQAVELMIT